MFEFVWLWTWALLPLAWLVYRFSKPVVQPAAIQLSKLPSGVGQKQPRSIVRNVKC